MQKAILSVDFGSKNTVVCISKDNNVRLVNSPEGSTYWPTMISFDDLGRHFGGYSLSLIHSNISRTLVDFKRYIGKKYKDVHDCNIPIENNDDRINFVFSSKNNKRILLSVPECVSYFIDGILKSVAEEVDEIVFVVPGFWGRDHHMDLVTAAKICNIKTVHLVSNAIAQFVYYIVKQKPSDSETICFFDVGHKNSDMSIVSLQKNEGRFNIGIVAYNHTDVGGYHITEKLAQRILDTSTQENLDYISRIMPQDLDHPMKEYNPFILSVENVKKKLSNDIVSQLTVEIDGSTKILAEIQRMEFEDAASDVFEKFNQMIENLKREVKTYFGDLKYAFFGESSKIPKIHKIVSNHFGDEEKKRYKQIDETKTSIAEGAAYYGMYYKSPNSPINFVINSSTETISDIDVYIQHENEIKLQENDTKDVTIYKQLVEDFYSELDTMISYNQSFERQYRELYNDTKEFFVNNDNNDCELLRRELLIRHNVANMITSGFTLSEAYEKSTLRFGVGVKREIKDPFISIITDDSLHLMKEIFDRINDTIEISFDDSFSSGSPEPTLVDDENLKNTEDDWFTDDSDTKDEPIQSQSSNKTEDLKALEESILSLKKIEIDANKEYEDNIHNLMLDRLEKYLRKHYENQKNLNSYKMQMLNELKKEAEMYDEEFNDKKESFYNKRTENIKMMMPLRREMRRQLSEESDLVEKKRVNRCFEMFKLQTVEEMVQDPKKLNIYNRFTELLNYNSAGTNYLPHFNRKMYGYLDQYQIKVVANDLIYKVLSKLSRNYHLIYDILYWEKNYAIYEGTTKYFEMYIENRLL